MKICSCYLFWEVTIKNPLNPRFFKQYSNALGGFKYVFFTPREMIQFDEHIFSTGLNHQLELYINGVK